MSRLWDSRDDHHVQLTPPQQAELERRLKQRDEVWKADVQSKIKQGMDSIRAGRSIPAEQIRTEMAEFKKKWQRNRSLK